ncbi:RING-H2 finger protein ATL52-like [Zingiber officinale]|uniref:RING-H2 finger protein ATL52-like n=1 Tax=Zingiber officinale TaxID=94328 RepID=UPI001C4A7EF5|nr:RING-H2 finger protein ATL52-like [Zingiber officinale]
MALYLRILSDETKADNEPEVPPPPPSLSSFDYQHNRLFSNVLLIGAALFSSALLLSIIYYAVLRRRRCPSLAAADLSVGGNQDDGSSSGEGDPLHHVWYIRTEGLEESTISSISVAEYRAGDGHLESASTCSVCLGEFCDGDRVRLLPKCAHAFHVPCIDTWLRAHVNCPLCRALIVGPQGEPALSGLDPSTTTSRNSMGSVSVSSGVAGRHVGNPLLDEQQNGGSQNSIDVVTPVNPFGEFDSVPQSSSSQEKIDMGANSLQPVTRSVSMDTPLMNSLAVRIEPGQAIFDKDGKDANFIGGSAGKGTSFKELANQKDPSDIERSVSTNGRGFFFSRHGRVARIHSMHI